jgi:glucose/arabinose dehydrogenase
VLAASAGPNSTASAATIPSALIFTPVASGLSLPVFVTNAGDGSDRLFIVQQGGQIRILKDSGLLTTPFLDISASVSNFTGANGEQGLLGLAFDPAYSTNGIFYITYTTANPDPTFKYTTTLARYHRSSGNPDVADSSSAVVLLSIPKKYANHNGGMLAFGPDGYLYMSMGDGGSGGDPDNNAQKFDTLLGKLLRLDVESTPPAGKMYVIPPTNPFFGSTDPNVKQEIWSSGLRNPWRFSFDSLTGDLYIGDVGQNTEEEVDYQASASAGGQNYGWNTLEGNLCYLPAVDCEAPSGYVAPVATYDHGVNDSFGCSITGGYVYRGNQSPPLQGVYFYGDYCSGRVFGLIKNANNTWSSSVIVTTEFNITSFGPDEQGELYLTNYGAGTIYHISSVPPTISGNAGIDGATLSLTDGMAKTVTSAENGSYSFTVSKNWTGTVTPSKTCYAFSPPSTSYINLTAEQTSQDYTAAVDPTAGCADVTISVAGAWKGTYGIPPGGQVHPIYPEVFNGPANAASINAQKIFASERQIYKGSFAESMGIPYTDLTTDYWFPWYDAATMSTWITVAAPGTNSVNAMVDIYIGTSKMNSIPYDVPVGGEVHPIFPGTFNGPVHVVSTNGENIITSERQIFKSTFAESMGIPGDQLTTDYWFPWYDGTTMNTWITVAAPSTNAADAVVDIYIGTTKMNATSYVIAAGAQVHPIYPGTFNGPVHVVSTNSQDIITSERQIFNNSFAESMGIPGNQLTTEYWFPWYDGMTMSTWVTVAAPANNSVDALVDVYVGGTKMNSSPYHVPAGGQVHPIYPGAFNGPVHVVSTNGQDIFASERQIYNSSFAESMGFANNRLTTEYWFPWYDALTMSTWITIGAP